MYKMNEIVPMFLLAWDKFMPEMHLRPSGFLYSTCLQKTKYHLPKTKKEYKKFKEAGDSLYVYQNKIHKACFQ